MPIPAAGLLIASFPLVYWFSNSVWQVELLRNKWFWYSLIVMVSYLMVSTLPMLALKFAKVDTKKLLPFIILVVIAVVCAILSGWMAVAITFAAYVIISLVFNKK